MLRARQNLEIDQMKNFLSQKSWAYELHWTTPYVKLVGLSSNKYIQVVCASIQRSLDWNALPDSLISSAEDADDCVAKFTSLVRARD